MPDALIPVVDVASHWRSLNDRNAREPVSRVAQSLLDAGLRSRVPCVVDHDELRFGPGDWARAHVDASIAELVEEREAVRSLEML